MVWNWQQPDWPAFSYDNEQLLELEKKFVSQTGIIIGAYKHVNEENKQEMIIDVISDEALKTSEIEGEYLNRDSLQSSIRKNFGLTTDPGKATPAEQGVSEMMVDLHSNYDRKLDHNALFNWHKMLTRGKTGLKDTGKYRSHKDPMQVVSGHIHKPKIHFEAPPSESMPKEMDKFITWFNNAALPDARQMNTLARAGIAHLYFDSIHPFEDGNGRIARALAEKLLSKQTGRPVLLALSYIIEKNKKKYYAILEKSNKNNEITPYLIYFSKTILDAQQYTLKLIDFIIKKTKLFSRVQGILNKRQEKVLERLFKEGPDGFKGGLSANNYSSITKAPRATTTRDLQDLVIKNILFKTGELKGSRYYLNWSGAATTIRQDRRIK